MKIQQRPGHVGPGREFRGVEVRGWWRGARFQEGLGGRPVLLVLPPMFFEQGAERGDLFGFRVSRQCLPPGPGDAGVFVALALPQNPRGKLAGGLDIGRIVQQHERLLRNVGPAARYF